MGKGDPDVDQRWPIMTTMYSDEHSGVSSLCNILAGDAHCTQLGVVYQAIERENGRVSVVITRDGDATECENIGRIRRKQKRDLRKWKGPLALISPRPSTRMPKLSALCVRGDRSLCPVGPVTHIMTRAFPLRPAHVSRSRQLHLCQFPPFTLDGQLRQESRPSRHIDSLLREKQTEKSKKAQET
jgi:hypothetical protein